LTTKAHDEGGLLVYIDPQSHAPVAYQWGGLLSPGILDVRNGMRGHGIGKALVEHCLALADEAGEDLLSIQCKPSTSIPFWQAMGFTLLGNKEPHEQENYAYRVMQRVRGPFDGDSTSEVAIEWYPEERKWDAAVPAVESQSIQGAWFGDELELEERASFFADLVPHDVVVRIVVDGQEWYCDKAKYERAEFVGVERCRNGYRVDTLSRPPTR